MKIRRLLVVAAICVTAVAGSKAEERIKPARIGMLLPGSEASSGYLKGLYQGLAEQGMVEGKNISLEIAMRTDGSINYPHWPPSWPARAST
jgi:hypothetical protein